MSDPVLPIVEAGCRDMEGGPGKDSGRVSLPPGRPETLPLRIATHSIFGPNSMAETG